MSTLEAPSSTQFDARSQHYQELKGRIHTGAAQPAEPGTSHDDRAA